MKRIIFWVLLISKLSFSAEFVDSTEARQIIHTIQPSQLRYPSYNVLGELILKMYPKTNNFKLNLSSQPDGIYVVKFISNNNVYQQKIVKQ